MRYFVLVLMFTMTLMGSNECRTCHQNEAQSMTSQCATCHTGTKQHQKDNQQKTSPVTLKNYQHFYSDDKPIIRNYQGLMPKDYGAKKVFHMKSDLHFQSGMVCQDCHNSSELHDDRFWLGKKESGIKCQDCHGTIQAYPWELLPADQNFSSATISSKVTKKGDTLLFHLANNTDLELKPLKLLKRSNSLSKAASIAMENISGHIDKLECSSCHATWAPQFYGSSITIDRRVKKKSKQLSKSADFMRWEEPFLIQNKNGKIAPAVPKTPLRIITIEKNATQVTQEKENLLEAIHPHTIQKEARSCESCHTSFKVLSGSVDAGMFQDSNVTYFNLSKVLSEEQRDKLDRRGVCLSCHETIPDGNLAISAISHISQMVKMDVDEQEHKTILNRILNMSAWFQIILVLSVVIILVYTIYTTVIKKRSINPRNKGWK